MAQNIQLKRSALPGKVPDTGSLNLGEIAINTYDGKVFLKKSGSIESVESIVTTNSINTGSITLTKTGSFGELVVTQDVNIQRDLYVVNDIIGNGDIDVLGNITGSNLLIKGTLTAQSYIVSSSVVNMTTQFASGSTIFGNTSDDTHQFTGSVNITGSGFINSNRIITSADTSSFATSGGYPASGIDYDTDTVTVVDFNNESPQFLIDYLYEIPVGTEVGLKGFLGNTSGSTLVVPANDYIAFVIDDAEVARVTVDGFQGVSLPAGLITGSSQLTSSYDTRYVISGSITQTTWNNIASKPNGIVSGSIQVLGGTDIISSSTQLNNTTIENLTITNLTTINETASVIYSSGSNRFGDFENDAHQFTGSVQMSGSLNVIGGLTGSIAATNGVVSGSSQLTSSYDTRYVISGSITQTTWDNIASKPSGIVSGSSQVTASLDTRYALSGSTGASAVLDSRSRYLSQSTAATTWSFTHNIGSEYPMVTVYGSNNEIIQPEYVKSLSINQTEIGFGTPVSGVAVASLGSLTEVTGKTIRQDFTASVSWSFVHNLGDKYVMIQAFDTSDQMILPAEIKLANTTSSIITFSEPVEGYALATIGGDLPTISSSYEGYTLQVQTGSAVWVSIVSASVSNAVSSSYVLYSNVANKPTLVSGSSQLTSSYDARYVLSGSITQTTWDNIASKPSGIVSGSSQVVSILDSLNTYTASVSSASLVTSIGNLTSKTGSYATTGSNTFVGTQTLSGSIIPAIDNVYDLGSATYQWRDIYVSSGSLYIDGTKVLGSTGNELQITTDVGQSIKILEAGSDSIILQSADGDIQLKTSGGGNLLFDPTTGLIDVRGTFQIQDGYKVTSSGGNSIQFGNDLGITGSITTSGNVNGINLTTFSSSVATQMSTIQTNTGSSNIRLSNLESKSASVDISITNINSFTASNGNTSLNNLTGSLATTGSNTFFGTQTFSGSVYIANDLIVQGSSSIQYISASSVSIGTNIVQLNTANPSVRYAGLTMIDSGSIGGSGSFLYDSVQDEFIFVHRGNGVNVTSSHFVLGPETYDNLGNETYLTTNILPKGTGKEHLNDSNITDTGTLITLGSNTSVSGMLTATGLTGSIAATNGVVSGSSQTINYLNSAAPGVVSGSSQTIANLPTGTVSGSSQVVSILSSLNTYTGSNDTTNTAQNTRLTTIESVTGSYETKGRSVVSGSSQITFSGISSLPTLVSGSSQITLSSTTGGGTSAAVQFGSLGIGTAASTALPVTVYTSSANVNNVIAEFYNGDYTSGTKNFIRVRNNVSIGSTYSSYFGQGQDGNTYIVSNDFTRGGDIVINANTGKTTIKTGLDVTGSISTTSNITIGAANAGQPAMYITRVGGFPTIKGSTANGGDGQIVIDGVSNSAGVYLNNYVSGSVYLATGGGTTYVGQLTPHSNNSFDLGSSVSAWRNIYTNDLHLSNEGKPEGNDIDGTTGNWTIQEGAEHLYIINNKTGKKFKFSLEEIQ